MHLRRLLLCLFSKAFGNHTAFQFFSLSNRTYQKKHKLLEPALIQTNSRNHRISVTKASPHRLILVLMMELYTMKLTLTSTLVTACGMQMDAKTEVGTSWNMCPQFDMQNSTGDFCPTQHPPNTSHPPPPCPYPSSRPLALAELDQEVITTEAVEKESSSPFPRCSEIIVKNSSEGWIT